MPKRGGEKEEEEWGKGGREEEQEEGRRGRENSRQRKRRSGKDVGEQEEEGQEEEEEEEGTIGRIPGSGALAPQNLGNRKIRLGLC